MKVRNKNTGEVIVLKIVQLGDNYMLDHEVKTINGEELTLKTFDRYFEDYEEKRPLIDYERERNVIRLWADVVDITEVKYDGNKDYIYVPDCDDVILSFDKYDVFGKLKHGQLYTITELCGEENVNTVI